MGRGSRRSRRHPASNQLDGHEQISYLIQGRVFKDGVIQEATTDSYAGLTNS